MPAKTCDDACRSGADLCDECREGYGEYWTDREEEVGGWVEAHAEWSAHAMTEQEATELAANASMRPLCEMS